MNADHPPQAGAGAGEREDRQPAEAEADRGEAAVRLGACGQGGQTGLCAVIAMPGSPLR